MHAVGARAPFAHRLTLDVATYGDVSRDFLLEHRLVTDDVAERWRGLADQALAACRERFRRALAARSLRLHGDCHPGNVLWTDAGPHFVDLDDAVTGPAVQDLWMLLSGDRAAKTRQLLDVLEGYEAFMDFDWRELALVEPLAHAAHAAPQRLDRAPLERPDLPDQFPVVREPGLLGRPVHAPGRAARSDGRASARQPGLRRPAQSRARSAPERVAIRPAARR